ncbi:ubiquinone anaerobic biosynthesis accessory factor UbiT [Salinibius halmophilus]|uniref:ubiquinone anaerobic biosynthesis accessory factor UbiT n=1 Tax=Salinibius halmophilus TaxID=1853216 RepID=UPI000E66A8DE|nr:SCP2 sterol-binding domain-containing protein [Salinibius halmophilus]
MLHKRLAVLLFNQLCKRSEPYAIHNRWIAIEFDYFPTPVYLCRTSQGNTIMGTPRHTDVTLGASYRGVLSMLQSECDADGLFFQRQFYYHGDTELGLALKTWLSDLSYQLFDRH